MWKLLYRCYTPKSIQMYSHMKKKPFPVSANLFRTGFLMRSSLQCRFRGLQAAHHRVVVCSLNGPLQPFNQHYCPVAGQWLLINFNQGLALRQMTPSDTCLTLEHFGTLWYLQGVLESCGIKMGPNNHPSTNVLDSLDSLCLCCYSVFGFVKPVC